VKSDSSSFGSGGEDWITRKRVETKTVRNIEKRVQRQVVLEDGRVIEEDDPEVTLDTIEDVESHSDDADDEVQQIGALVHFSSEASPWAPGYNVAGEKQQRNIRTHKVDKKSVTTSCANNLGDLSVKDIDAVIKRGKKASSLARTKDYDGDPGKIPARITHKDANRQKTVDVEDVREINSMNAQGQSRTQRLVNREVIDDHEDETPSDGESTEETESRDGDRDAFSQRKEDRIIDYYKFQKGKSMSEAKFIRRGLHMTSYDKNDQAGGALNYTSNRPALRYDSDSTTNSGHQHPAVRKPPRHDRSHRGSRGPSRMSSSEREDSRRFHTIERTSYAPFGVSTSVSRGASEEKTPYRSRSMSRSPHYAEAKRDLKSSRDLNKSTGNIMRADLDKERAGRLRRAMSFKDTSTRGSAGPGSVAGSASSAPKTSFMDSMKSLYATLSKATISKAASKTSTTGQSPPKRPPRKPRSQSSMSDHNRSNSSLYIPKESSKTTLDGRTWNVHSSSSTLPRSFNSRPSPSSTLPRSSYSRPTPAPRPAPPPKPINRGSSKTRLSISGTSRASSVMSDNRDPPRFERQRDFNNRFFGQDITDDNEVVARSRPPPDMRRHLLDNVNATRGRNALRQQQPSVIQAM